MRIRKLLMTAALALAFLVPGTALAAEKNVFEQPCDPATGTTAESSVCQAQNAGDPITGTNGVLAKAARLISYLAGATAIILLIVGGFMYVTSDGEASKLSTAKNTVIYAVVGLVVVVFAQSIIIFVINKV